MTVAKEQAVTVNLTKNGGYETLKQTLPNNQPLQTNTRQYREVAGANTGDRREANR
jgi:hypothetical protein